MKFINSISFVESSPMNPGGAISLVKTHNGEDGRLNIWAVRMGNSCLNKKELFFEYEPSPSNRDESFFDECRFNSPEEALDSFRLWLNKSSDKMQMGQYYRNNFHYDELKLFLKKLTTI